MARVFLSYERHSRSGVDLLAADLRRAGYEPFFDEQLTGGQSWWTQLLDQIERCAVFMPALSRGYVQSVPCRREAEYAHALGKPVLPVMLEAMNPAECADFIAESHCVTYVPGDSAAAIDLMRALVQMPDAPPLPDPMPARPDIPMSYVAASIQAAKDRIESPADLPLDDQIRLLSDIRSLLAQHEDTARALLLELRQRGDVTMRIASEIDALLAVHGAAPSPGVDAQPESSSAAAIHVPPQPQPRPHELAAFISYRRNDSGPVARRLYDALSTRFGQGQAFLGIDSAVPGWDLDTVLAMLDRAAGLLVVIGPQWLDATDADRRCLDDPADYVRMQLERALTNGRPHVIAALVGGAVMPTAEALPPSLAPLAACPAVELGDDRWQPAVDELVGVLEALR